VRLRNDRAELKYQTSLIRQEAERKKNKIKKPFEGGQFVEPERPKEMGKKNVTPYDQTRKDG